MLKELRKTNLTNLEPKFLSYYIQSKQILNYNLNNLKTISIEFRSKEDSAQEVPYVVLGVKDEIIDSHTQIFSNASCTTNNVAPLIKVLDDNWGKSNALKYLP